METQVKIETARLFLRCMAPDDRPALCRILQDPVAMRAYEHAFSEEEVDRWLEKQLERYRRDGIGLWAVILRETGEMIGQCGLTWQDIPDGRVPEIGYLFERAHWHRGYATEAAIACKHYAFATLDFPAVYSIIRDINLPSQRVAERNGMTRIGSFVKHYYGVDMPHWIYWVERGRASI